jgi:argininosuccinate lyase
MFAEDIDGSVAHAAMLGAQGIISAADCDTIITHLQHIKQKSSPGIDD